MLVAGRLICRLKRTSWLCVDLAVHAPASCSQKNVTWTPVSCCPGLLTLCSKQPVRLVNRVHTREFGLPESQQICLQESLWDKLNHFFMDLSFLCNLLQPPFAVSRKRARPSYRQICFTGLFLVCTIYCTMVAKPWLSMLQPRYPMLSVAAAQARGRLTQVRCALAGSLLCACFYSSAVASCFDKEL